MNSYHTAVRIVSKIDLKFAISFILIVSDEAPSPQKNISEYASQNDIPQSNFACSSVGTSVMEVEEPMVVIPQKGEVNLYVTGRWLTF